MVPHLIYFSGGAFTDSVNRGQGNFIIPEENLPDSRIRKIINFFAEDITK